MLHLIKLELVENHKSEIINVRGLVLGKEIVQGYH